MVKNGERAKNIQPVSQKENHTTPTSNISPDRIHAVLNPQLADCLKEYNLLEGRMEQMEKQFEQVRIQQNQEIERLEAELEEYRADPEHVVERYSAIILRLNNIFRDLVFNCLAFNESEHLLDFITRALDAIPTQFTGDREFLQHLYDEIQSRLG